MANQPISRYLLVTTLLVSLLTTLGLGVLWIANDLRQSANEVAFYRRQLINTKRAELEAEVRNSMRYIEIQRGTIETRLSDAIKTRVLEAHAIATHLYNAYKDQLSDIELKRLVREALRPVRFHGGRGYYFALNMNGTELLTAVRPLEETIHLSDLAGVDGQSLVDRMTALIRKQEEGFVSYTWEKPNANGTDHPKISFIKYFEPFDWIIGAGEYVEDVEQGVKEDILTKLETIRFGETGYLFAGTHSGVSLLGPGKGKNMLHVQDMHGVPIVKELIKLARGGGDFLEYQFPGLDGQPPHAKLSYVISVPDWQWYLGAGVNIDDVEDAVASLEERAQRDLQRTVLTVFIALLVLGGLLYTLFKSMTVRVNRDISSLMQFFQHAGKDGAETYIRDMRFQETASIGQAAHAMLQNYLAGSAALRKSEERFKLAMDATSDGLWDWDITTGDVYYSPAYGAMLGYASDEVIQRLEYWSERIHPADKPAVMEANMQCVENLTTSFEVEFRMLAKNGQWRWILGRGTAVSRDASGRALRIVGTHTDITVRKEAEAALHQAKNALAEQVEERTKAIAQKAEELEAANEALRQNDALKSSLMTTVSHELRTPLTSIYGFVKLIRKDFTSRFQEACRVVPGLEGRCQRIEANLDIIESEGRRLGRIINDFLDLSKIESGHMAWNDAPVSTRALLEHAALLVAPSFEGKEGVSLTLQHPEEHSILHIDEDRLVQVLVNLLDNACKHTNKGEVLLSAVPNREAVRFTVADSGVGIPEKDLERIFETFYQSPGAEALGVVTKGTGLGLAICRQIVTHYGGSIWAESSLGQGATFHVEIPLSPEQRAAAPPAS